MHTVFQAKQSDSSTGARHLRRGEARAPPESTMACGASSGSGRDTNPRRAGVPACERSRQDRAQPDRNATHLLASVADGCERATSSEPDRPSPRKLRPHRLRRTALQSGCLVHGCERIALAGVSAPACAEHCPSTRIRRRFPGDSDSQGQQALTIDHPQ